MRGLQESDNVVIEMLLNSERVLKEQLSDLDDRLDDIEDTLDQIKEKTDETWHDVREIPAKFEDLEKAIEDVPTCEGPDMLCSEGHAVYASAGLRASLRDTDLLLEALRSELKSARAKSKTRLAEKASGNLKPVARMEADPLPVPGLMLLRRI